MQLLHVVTLATATLLLATGVAAASDGARGDGHPRSPVPVFLLEKGRFTTFDAPGTQANEVVDVNSRGQVAGTYVGQDGTNHGFVRDKRGRVTLFDYPGASATFVNKINRVGQIVGAVLVPTPSEPQGQRAYLRSPDGSFRTISVPGAVVTQAIGLDDRGRVVGDYTMADGSFHGYLWQGGRFVTTSIEGPEGRGATLTGLNDRGQIVGVYQPRGTAGLHGFLLDKGVYRVIRDSRFAFTVPFDISDRGRIVGLVTDAFPLDAATELHGFLLRSWAGSAMTRIDVPGAPRTAVFGIDDRGRIVGLYENPNARTAAQAMPAPLLDALPIAVAGRRETR
jgi:uncharacterized membrane protein